MSDARLPERSHYEFNAPFGPADGYGDLKVDKRVLLRLDRHRMNAVEMPLAFDIFGGINARW
jgi:hypothetical protein